MCSFVPHGDCGRVLEAVLGQPGGGSVPSGARDIDTTDPPNGCMGGAPPDSGITGRGAVWLQAETAGQPNRLRPSRVGTSMVAQSCECAGRLGSLGASFFPQEHSKRSGYHCADHTGPHWHHRGSHGQFHAELQPQGVGCGYGTQQDDRDGGYWSHDIPLMVMAALGPWA